MPTEPNRSTCKIEYTLYSMRYTLTECGGRVEDSCHAFADEHGTHGTLEAAIAEARALEAQPGNVRLLRRPRGSIGRIAHVVYYVDAFTLDEDGGGRVPCDENGERDEWGGAESLYYHDTLDDEPRLKAAFDSALRQKHRFLDYEADEFYPVGDFLDGE